MKIFEINPKDPSQEAIQEAVKMIKWGGSVVYPTDTVYGLGVEALSERAVSRLFKIKKRPLNKPVPVMVKDIAMAKKLAFIDRKIERVLERVWPGPVTVVLEKRGIVPTILTAGQPKIGLRIPDYQLTQLLMEQLDQPITTTSANFSGEPPLLCAEEIIKIFQKIYPRPDLILDAGCLEKKSPSTVLDLTGPKPKILRLGPVSKKDLLDILE